MVGFLLNNCQISGLFLWGDACLQRFRITAKNGQRGLKFVGQIGGCLTAVLLILLSCSFSCFQLTNLILL